MPALEGAMDELARQIGMDPVELRLRNIPEKHPANGKPFGSHMLAECLEQGAKAFGWESGSHEPARRREGEWWIGQGMASSARVHLQHPASARVRLEPDGTATVETDMTDIGTGTYTVLGQIAGEMLGLPQDKVLVQLGDTAFPRGAGSGGSFGAASTGSAVQVACEAVREKIAKKLGCDPDDLELEDGMARGGGDPVSFADLLGGSPIEEEGVFKPGKTDEEKTQSSFGAVFSEVAVNGWTGEVRVRRMLGRFAIGRVLNHKTARSQCLGGLVWAIGSALTEALEFDLRDGHCATPDLATYHVPVQLDIPPLDVDFIEERDPDASLLQAKGVGELGMCGGAGAIANAVYDACGVRCRDFPLTPDRLVTHLPPM